MVEAWKQMIEKRGDIKKLNLEINSLKERAVKELRKMGYSHDKICGILSMGKVNSIKFAKRKKK